MYYLGEGTEVDMEKAFGYYLRAAELNDADAQFRVGKMYFEGQGTKKDEEKSLAWMRTSASNGNKFAEEIVRQYDEIRSKTVRM